MLVVFVVFRVPDQVPDLAGEVAVRLENRDAVMVGHLDQAVLEPAHLLPAPASQGPFVEALGLVRHHQVFADSDDLAESPADGAGAEGRVETEKVLVRLTEKDAVQFETAAETAQDTFLPCQGDMSVASCKGVGYGGKQARAGIGIHRTGQADAVHQQGCIGERIRPALQDIVDPDRNAVRPEPVVTVFLELQEQFRTVFPPGPLQVGEQIPGPGTRGGKCIQHVRDAVPADLPPRNRRESVPDAGENQPQEIVDLRGGGHGGPGIAHADLLFDGDGRRDAVDAVHVGLGHPPEELAGIRRKAFRETALPLGIQGIESKGGLPRTGNARDDHELPTRNPQGQIFEIIDPGALDFNESFHLFLDGVLR